MLLMPVVGSISTLYGFGPANCASLSTLMIDLSIESATPLPIDASVPRLRYFSNIPGATASNCAILFRFSVVFGAPCLSSTALIVAASSAIIALHASGVRHTLPRVECPLSCHAAPHHDQTSRMSCVHCGLPWLASTSHCLCRLC